MRTYGNPRIQNPNVPNVTSDAAARFWPSSTLSIEMRLTTGDVMSTTISRIMAANTKNVPMWWTNLPRPILTCCHQTTYVRRGKKSVCCPEARASKCSVDGQMVVGGRGGERRTARDKLSRTTGDRDV